MAGSWDADTPIDAARARALVVSQFPELAPVTATVLGEGFDNLAVVVNGSWVFRFPRRRLGAELHDHEMAWLPVVPELALPIPRAALLIREVAGGPAETSRYTGPRRWLHGDLHPGHLLLDADTWRRARFRAIFYAVLLIDYGHESGDAASLAVGLDSLRNVLDGRR